MRMGCVSGCLLLPSSRALPPRRQCRFVTRRCLNPHSVMQPIHACPPPPCCQEFMPRTRFPFRAYRHTPAHFSRLLPRIWHCFFLWLFLLFLLTIAVSSLRLVLSKETGQRDCYYRNHTLFHHTLFRFYLSHLSVVYLHCFSRGEGGNQPELRC